MKRPHRSDRPRTADFQSANTGSNPVGATIKHKHGIEDFLIVTEGRDVFDPYAEEPNWDDYGYEPWKD